MALFGPVVTYQVSAVIVATMKIRRSGHLRLRKPGRWVTVRETATAQTAAMYSHADAGSGWTGG